MKNLGLHDLVLVNPQCEPLSVEAKLMAVHAVDILESAPAGGDVAASVAWVYEGDRHNCSCSYLGNSAGNPARHYPWLLEEPGTAALILVQNTGG